MNKQRKFMITVTYNELGIIIDTKAEEVTQPIDWAKAQDLRAACRRDEKIDDELGVTGVTEAAHLKEEAKG